MKKNLRSYTIEHYTNDKGQFVESRHNKGFSPIELLGVLWRVMDQINNQIKNSQIQPTKTTAYCDGKKIDPKRMEGAK